MTEQYFLKRGETVKGPFSLAKLQNLLSAKKLKANDLIGTSDDGPWERISAVHKTIRAGQPLSLSTLEPAAGPATDETKVIGTHKDNHKKLIFAAVVAGTCIAMASIALIIRGTGGKDSVIAGDHNQQTSVTPNREQSATVRLAQQVAEDEPPAQHGPGILSPVAVPPHNIPVVAVPPHNIPAVPGSSPPETRHDKEESTEGYSKETLEAFIRVNELMAKAPNADPRYAKEAREYRERLASLPTTRGPNIENIMRQQVTSGAAAAIKAGHVGLVQNFGKTALENGARELERTGEWSRVSSAMKSYLASRGAGPEGRDAMRKLTQRGPNIENIMRQQGNSGAAAAIKAGNLGLVRNFSQTALENGARELERTGEWSRVSSAMKSYLASRGAGPEGRDAMRKLGLQ